jgi:hypothetical protein
MNQEKIEILSELYRRGELPEEKVAIFDELVSRGEIADPYGEAEFETSGVLDTSVKGANVGLLDLAMAPVSAVEGLLKAGNIGLESLGVPEQFRLPVSEKGLSGTIRDLMPGTFVSTDENIRPDLKPFYVAGQTFGGGVGGLGLVGGLARTSLGQAKNFTKIDDFTPGTLKGAGRAVLETFRQAPKSTAATELGLTGLASVGGGFAEAAAPGSATARVIGEVGATLTPTALASRYLPSITQKVVNVVKTKTPAGAESEAARIVQQGLIDAGEDPLEYVSGLRSTVNEIPATPAQLTGSKYLTDLEQSLISDNANFGIEYKKRAEESMAAFNQAFKEAIGTGDPNKIIVAAQARKDNLEALLESKISAAENKARAAMSPIDRATPDLGVEASIKAKKIIQDALKVARSTENQLWKAVPKNVDVVPVNTANKIKEMKSELLETENLPQPLEGFGRKITQIVDGPPMTDEEKLLYQVFDMNIPDTEKLTVGELLTYRSRALEIYSKESAAGNRGDARRAKQIADSVLDDLDGIPGIQADTARSFSRKLNSKLTSGFAGEVLGTKGYGVERIPEEATLKRAMATPGPESEVRARQLREAVEPIEGAPVTPETMYGPAEMRKAQQDFLMSMVNKIKDPATQTVSANRLSNFISNNSRVIDQLGLRDTFSNAESAQRFAEQAVKRSKEASAFFDKRKIAARFIGKEDATEEVAKILNRSNTPTKDMADLIRLAKTDQTGEALEGLRIAVFDNILSKATSRTGYISANDMKSFLSRDYDGKTLKQVLMSSGALTPAQSKNLDRIMMKAQKFEDAFTSAGKIDGFLENESALFDLMTRLVGSKLGTQSVAGEAAGSSLVMASAGVRAVQQQALKLPAVKVRDVLIKATLDPKLMAMLLEKRTGAKAIRNSNSRIEAYLIDNLIIEDQEEQE